MSPLTAVPATPLRVPVLAPVSSVAVGVPIAGTAAGTVPYVPRGLSTNSISIPWITVPDAIWKIKSPVADALIIDVDISTRRLVS